MTEQDITAIVIIPPEHVQNQAWPMLHRHARDNLARLPAHITVLSPWVPDDELTAGCVALRELCAGITPFDLTLRGYGQFSGVTYMQLAEPAPFHNLFQRIAAIYLEHLPYEGVFGSKPKPHLTVGIFGSKAAQDTAEFPAYLPLTFSVTHLHVVTGPRNKPVPWDLVDVIALDG